MSPLSPLAWSGRFDPSLNQTSFPLIGAKFWEVVSDEHGIERDGLYDAL